MLPETQNGLQQISILKLCVMSFVLLSYSIIQEYVHRILRNERHEVAKEWNEEKEQSRKHLLQICLGLWVQKTQFS